MVDLPEIPKRFVTVQDVQDRITPGAIVAPYAMFSHILDNAADLADAVGARMGAEAGAAPGAKPGEGGLGAYGRAYEKAATAGAAAALSNDMTVKSAEIQAQFPADPAAQKTAMTAYADAQLAKYPEGSPAHRLIQLQIDQTSAQMQAQAIGQKVRIDTANGKDNITALIERNYNDALSLARQGQTDSPAFKAATGNMKGGYDQLGNPLFGVSAERRKLDFDQKSAEIEAQSIAGQADRLVEAGDFSKLTTLADQIEKVPNLEPSARARYSAVIRGAERAGKTAIIAAGKEVKQEADPVIAGLKAGTIAPEDSQVADLIGRARAVGRNDVAKDLNDFRLAKTIAPAIMALPPEQRRAALDALGQRAAPMSTGTGGAASFPLPANNDISPVMSAVEQKHGLPAGYLPRTAQIESGGRAHPPDSSSGAKGLFQFIPSTARQVGLANPYDPVASTEAAGRLAEANAKSLRLALGREPSAGELYLAHQQGAGGAAALLANPAAPAASIVGTKAVLANGGTQGMTAGQFANLWINKFNGAKGGVTTVDMSGGPNSPQSQNVVNIVVASVKHDSAEQLHQTLPGYLDVFEKGLIPDSASTAAVIDLAKIAGDDGALGKIKNALGDAAVQQQLDGATRSQLQDAIASVQEASATGGVDAATTRAYKMMQEEVKQRDELRAKDPIALAVADHQIPAPSPLDWSNQQGTLEAQLRARARAADVAATHAELPSVSIFHPAEKDAFSTFLQQAPADQVLGALGNMAKTLPGDTLGATMRDIGGDKNARPYVVAASLAAQGQVETAKAIVVGQRILAQKPELVAETFAKGADPVTPQVLPRTLFAPALTDVAASGKADPYTDTISAAKAIYAAGKGPDGTKDFDESLWRGSVTKAIGGFVYKQASSAAPSQRIGARSFQNSASGDGQQIIAPIPGMTQQEFSLRLDIARQADLRNMNNGLGAPVTDAQFMDQSKFEARGSGTYLLRLGKGYVLDSRTGRPFVLDFNARAPMNVSTVYDYGVR